jgi:hypothetical protein
VGDEIMTRLLQEVGDIDALIHFRETIPFPGWVKWTAAVPECWERANAIRITLPQIGVKDTVV